jgi:hypothetical protein
MRHPWSSVRCQWKVFILWSARRSTYFLTNSLGMKCRATSSIPPRHRNRGASSMRTAGIVHAADGVAGASRNTSGGSSWRIVCTA